jgi:hypothetical protein
LNSALKIVAAVILIAIVSFPAAAQTNWGHIGPTNAQIVGIAVGAGAAIAVTGIVLYAALHKQSVTGCVRTAGGTTNLTDSKNNHSYILIDGNSQLKTGERVRLEGKKKKDKFGNLTFQVKKIKQDYGVCQE